MKLDAIELWTGRIMAAGAFTTVAIALWGLRRGASRPIGREEGPARSFLSWPFISVATILFIGAGILMWRPLPLHPSASVRLGLLIIGTALLSSGLGIYLWGYRALGSMFGAASGFGVRLYASHELVTRGPFALVRHPMYLAVMAAFTGGLLIYRTWTMAVYAIIMLGLPFRARREDRALAKEFGEEWRAYARSVPGWIPRFHRKSSPSLTKSGQRKDIR